MVVGNLRPTRLVIDRSAIADNVKAVAAELTPNTAVFMVVKADGYGHGAVAVAQTAIAAGATGLCVAILDEAIQLREAGVSVPILVLGITAPEMAPMMAQQQISATVGDRAWLKAAEASLKTSAVKEPLHVHVVVDTGMGRIGLQSPDELTRTVALLEDHTHFFFEGVFTHFATADESDNRYFELQVSRWEAFMAVLDKRPKYVHVSNSATSIWHKACNGNMIRLGVAAYGLNPSGSELALPFELRPAMRLESKLDFVKKLPAGRSISYGATYTATEDEWIGTVPIGYADGYERRLQGFRVLVAGQFCEVVGRVCMDQLMVRLPKEYATGTKVTLVGREGAGSISLQEMADYCDTIHYEIACGFSARVPRVYEG